VRRELGVVLHADTLLDEGPAKDAAGEVRGAGVPVPASAGVARVAAGDLLDRGAATCVLLADETGHLVRMVRLGTASDTGWTRTTLIAATRRAIERAPVAQHQTDSYEPTVEIAETVRARDPVCTFPGCGVPASRCDLDHVVPHARGPTNVSNLSPRSRGCHRYKTAALWRCRTRLNHHGAVVAHEWTSPLGTPPGRRRRTPARMHWQVSSVGLAASVPPETRTCLPRCMRRRGSQQLGAPC